MACVDRVAKNGKNETQHYSYAMAADVYDAVRGELAKRFVLPVPRIGSVEFVELQTRNGGSMRLCTVRGFIDFTDAETGEVVQVPMAGQGSDSLDKAYYKAVTGATKSALVQTFLIPTGDDPEHEPKQSKAPAPAGMEAARARMAAAASKASGNGTAAHDRTLVYPFGNCKGLPISDPRVDEKSLAFWIQRLTEELSDSSKAKFHDNNRKKIATLEAEKAYRSRASSTPHAASPSVEEPPPPSDEDAPY